MITSSEEAWATDTLRDAQDPGAGKQSWPSLTRITLERYNLIFSQRHSRGYTSTGQPQHDAATCLENGKTIVVKVALDGGDLKFTKWSVANGLQYDDVVIVANVNISNTARPSVELTAGTQATIRVFYVDENDDEICYVESSDGGNSFGAEVSVGSQSNLGAIASVSPTKVHCVSYANGNSRFHYFELNGAWAETNSLIYWPHKIEHIDAITIGDRDLVVFYSEGPMYGDYREAGIYGIWVEHGRWSDIFKIDVLDEADAYAYRQHPMISEANGIYFLVGYLSEGDEDYSHATRFLKTSKDGQNWSQYMPLVTCPEAGPAKLLVVNAAAGESWPWDTGQQVYVVGYDKVYESDATRLVGEINTALQVDVSSRTRNWQLQRGVVSQANTVLSNHDGALDSHAIINADNTLLLKREAGYYTGEGDEYAQVTLEAVDFVKETDELPQRHKQVASRDFMAWVRDREADHFECWESQLVGYDNYADDTETGYGGLGHTATQKGWWETKNNVLWLRSNNEMGLAFATWDSKIMNGQVKAMIRVETAGNNEYAGVVFRAKDEGNFWAAYYNQATDKILLRRKVGGAWENAVAQSGTLSWSIDTWYGIMVDFRYGYFRVLYSTDGNTWTQAFTYIAPSNALAPAFEYGYVGLIGYGYSSEDEEEPPGYTPPAPPPTPTPSDGHLLYFICKNTGRVFRSRNARESDPTAVVYEDLGVVDAGGLLNITLDSWDPSNCAMVCGDNGIWRTTNLNDPIPTWVKVRDSVVAGNKWHRYKMVRSSICKQNRWMFVSAYWNGDQNDWFCWVGWSDDRGDSWTLYGIDHWANELTGAKEPRMELSSHNADVAWVVWSRKGDEVISRTADCWTSHVTRVIPGLHNSQRPTGYHRYLDNADDLCALFGGKSGTTALEGAVTWSLDDAVSGTTTKLNVGVAGDTYWVGGYTWGTNRYWALNYTALNGFEFHISDDAITWTLQAILPGTRFISGWPYEAERFYACRDGVVAPILISDDRGATWQEQTGNWAALGYNGDIRWCVPVWTE